MSSPRPPTALLGLVATFLLLAGLAWLAYGRGTEAPATGAAGSGPPADVARNPQAAKQFVRDETCRAGCTSEDRMCRATAADGEGQKACANALAACQARCP